MASSIFGGNGGIMPRNPQQVFDNLMRTNPQFARFVQENKGKTPEQAFREHGLDFGKFKGMLR